jgi:hypothetical protein
MNFPDPRQTLPNFWQHAITDYQTTLPASSSEIQHCEKVLKRPIPDGLCWLWSHTNGMFGDCGNTVIYSISDTIEETQKSWNKFYYPDEAIVIGNDGAGHDFVLWAPRSQHSLDAVVLVVIQYNWSSGNIQLAACNLPKFLWARHAFYAWLNLQDSQFGTARIEATAVEDIGACSPLSLGVSPFTDQHINTLYQIASKNLPEPPPDGWSTSILREKFGSS